jgi:hypothetical protein
MLRLLLAPAIRQFMERELVENASAYRETSTGRATLRMIEAAAEDFGLEELDIQSEYQEAEDIIWELAQEVVLDRKAA